MLNCCDGLAGAGPVIAVPVAVTVKVVVPAGVTVGVTTVCVCCDPPPQLVRPATMARTSRPPRTPARATLRFPAPSRTMPSANGLNAQSPAYTDRFDCGAINAACGPVVFTVSTVLTFGDDGVTDAVAGVKVHVTSAGRFPQEYLTVPKNPFRDFVEIVMFVDCPARSVALVCVDETE